MFTLPRPCVHVHHAGRSPTNTRYEIKPDQPAMRPGGGRRPGYKIEPRFFSYCCIADNKYG
jgi:hypothetical protein